MGSSSFVFIPQISLVRAGFFSSVVKDRFFREQFTVKTDCIPNFIVWSSFFDDSFLAYGVHCCFGADNIWFLLMFNFMSNQIKQIHLKSFPNLTIDLYSDRKISYWFKLETSFKRWNYWLSKHFYPLRERLSLCWVIWFSPSL